MANRLQIKRNVYGSNGAPAANSLLTGELAYDGHNQKLYIGRQTANNGNAQDNVVTDLGATIVPDASTSSKGVASFASADFAVSSGAVTISSVSNAQLAGSIANSKLANSSVTIGDSSISLGGTDTTLTGLTDIDLTSGNKTILDGVGSNTLTIGASGTTVNIAGNLTVGGTTTTLNTATLDVEDKNITVAKNAADSSAADGAGLTVDGASATFTYSHSGTKWNMNKSLDVVGTIEATQGIANTTLDFGTYAN
jgi:hypothetical protein